MHNTLLLPMDAYNPWAITFYEEDEALLYRIGTREELSRIESVFPEKVITELLTGVVVRGSEYGENRNYLEEGGYSIVLETEDDLNEFKKIIDYDRHPCEWATRIGKTGYISALYILNDDYTIDIFMPIDIAPEVLFNDLEE